PEKSELWELVRRGEMPPADSPQGPLTSDEKETIRAWIAAGALDVPRTAGESPTRVLPHIGKFHILVLHFPIALPLAAALGELLAWRSLFPSRAGRFCTWLAAIAAVPTVLLGWLFAWEGQGKGNLDLLFAHAWLGTAAGTWLLLTALGY